MRKARFPQTQTETLQLERNLANVFKEEFGASEAITEEKHGS